MKINRGFTLIELLVVIAIVGMLTTMSMAVIISVKQKRQTKAVAAQVQNIILEARAYAISPKNTPSVSGNIDIKVTANSIKAQVNNTDILNPITVTSKVSLSCSNNPCFSFYTGKADGTDSSKIGQATATTIIKATNSNSARETYSIKVNSLSGNVTVSTP